ncbi:MAG: ATPase [Myxococcales bacterium]|nr:ATPase [Myxococcales bacterium]
MNQALRSTEILKRFTLITGKGGVGKSTLAAVLALVSAKRGHKTLVCELNTHERVSRLLGHEPAGSSIKKLEDNLWSVNINPSEAMQEYGLMKLKFRAFYRLVFENPLVGALVRFIPGINDLLMLGKAFNHEREVDQNGQPVWDRIIIDAPATGHSLTFFTLPKVIMNAVPSGNMHRESHDMWSLLADPARCGIHLVSLPEELPIQETMELFSALTEDIQLPVSTVFLNQVPAPAIPRHLSDDFDQWVDAPSDEVIKPLWDAGKLRQQHVNDSNRFLKKLERLDCPVICLPMQYGIDFGRREIDALAQTIDEAITTRD